MQDCSNFLWPTCCESTLRDLLRGIQSAVKLNSNLSLPLFPFKGIPMQSSLLVKHGSSLLPHSTFGVSSVRVTSWSKNCPQVMVMWVKFALMPFSSLLLLRNTTRLIRLGFGKGWLFTAVLLRGWSFGCWYSAPRLRKRLSGLPVAPWVMLHKLLHEPLIVRYLYWRHANRSLSSSRQFVSSSVSKVCWAASFEDDTWRTSYAKPVRKIPKRSLKATITKLA